MGMVLAAALHVAALGAVLADLGEPPTPQFPIVVDIVADGTLPATGGPKIQPADQTTWQTTTHRLADNSTVEAPGNEVLQAANDEATVDTAQPVMEASRATMRDPMPDDAFVGSGGYDISVSASLPDAIESAPQPTALRPDAAQTDEASTAETTQDPPLPASKPDLVSEAHDDVVPAPTQARAPGAGAGQTTTADVQEAAPSTVSGSHDAGLGGAGTTTAPAFSDGALGNKAPDYPYRARRLGQEGQVVLLVAVSAHGRVQAIDISLSSGHRLLDEAALDAVAEWRFHPAHINGFPVTGSVMVPIHFDLED